MRIIFSRIFNFFPEYVLFDNLSTALQDHPYPVEISLRQVLLFDIEIEFSTISPHHVRPVRFYRAQLQKKEPIPTVFQNIFPFLFALPEGAAAVNAAGNSLAVVEHFPLYQIGIAEKLTAPRFAVLRFRDSEFFAAGVVVFKIAFAVEIERREFLEGRKRTLFGKGNFKLKRSWTMGIKLRAQT